MVENANFPQAVEVRGLVMLREVFKERGWPIPYYVQLSKPCSAYEE